MNTHAEQNRTQPAQKIERAVEDAECQNPDANPAPHQIAETTSLDTASASGHRAGRATISSVPNASVLFIEPRRHHWRRRGGPHDRDLRPSSSPGPGGDGSRGCTATGRE